MKCNKRFKKNCNVYTNRSKSPIDAERVKDRTEDRKSKEEVGYRIASHLKRPEQKKGLTC